MKVKQKILCFHGNGSNADILTYQLRQFKKEFKDIEFITLNGPIAVNKNVIADENFFKMVENQNIYSWVNFLKLKSDLDSAFDTGLEAIIKILKDEGPFFGVMGFSQGSALAVRLATLIAAKELDLGYDLKCFIFSSAVASYLPYDKQLLCRIPSLHLIGFNDFVNDRSLGLAAQFLNPLIIHHNQGHKVPTLTHDQVIQLKKFFEDPQREWKNQIFYPRL